MTFKTKFKYLCRKKESIELENIPYLYSNDSFWKNGEILKMNNV